MNRLKTSIKRWLINKFFNWDEFWFDVIPDVDTIRDVRYNTVNKDRSYWETVASVIMNVSFLNELAELQKSYDTKAARALHDNNFVDAQKYVYIAEGTKAINKIILRAKRNIDEDVYGRKNESS